MGEWLTSRLPDFVDVAGFLDEGRFVYGTGRVVAGDDPYRPHTFVWFHRDEPDEVIVPGQIRIVHRDDRLVVVDKPAFLASIPRGRHVRESVVVRLRAALGLPHLSPLHRLDRVTSGLMMLATERRWRGPYQSLFQRGEVAKTYHALAPVRPQIALPTIVRNHLVKRRGRWQVEVVPDAPVNAETVIELQGLLDGLGLYRLTPKTGRTHQLRVHMLGLGLPIDGDPLYPTVHDIAEDDFTRPLQLLASGLRFDDPIDGLERRFHSVRRLPLQPSD